MKFSEAATESRRKLEPGFYWSRLWRCGEWHINEVFQTRNGKRCYNSHRVIVGLDSYLFHRGPASVINGRIEPPPVTLYSDEH